MLPLILQLKENHLMSVKARRTKSMEQLGGYVVDAQICKGNGTWFVSKTKVRGTYDSRDLIEVVMEWPKHVNPDFDAFYVFEGDWTFEAWEDSFDCTHLSAHRSREAARKAGYRV